MMLLWWNKLGLLLKSPNSVMFNNFSKFSCILAMCWSCAMSSPYIIHELSKHVQFNPLHDFIFYESICHKTISTTLKLLKGFDFVTDWYLHMYCGKLDNIDKSWEEHNKGAINHFKILVCWTMPKIGIFYNGSMKWPAQLSHKFLVTNQPNNEMVL